MEQPSKPHIVRVRCASAGRNARRRHPGVCRDLGTGAQGCPQRLFPFLPTHLLRESVQTSRHRAERFPRLGSPSDRRFHVQGRDQRRSGTTTEPDQSRGKFTGAWPGAPRPTRRR